jgi:TatD family hydrolase
VIGLGETGLDYITTIRPRDAAGAVSHPHPRGRETGLPLIIHTRDAEEDTARILEEEMREGAFPALIHCFTASAAFGRRMLDLGLTISLSGIVTFKNARELQAMAAEIPDELLVETDLPFLAPVPHRGNGANRPIRPIRRALWRLARRVRGGSGRRPPPISIDSSHQGRAPEGRHEAGHAGQRHIDRRAAHRRRGWQGRLGPVRPE